MRRLKYLFTVPKGEKVTEKHFRRVLTSSVCSILLCMSCLISTTWALFTTTVVSQGNSIEMGTFDVSVTVEKDGQTQPYAENAYAYSLEEIGNYKITIRNIGTAKGYCEVTIGEDTATTGTLFPEMAVSFTVDVNETGQGGLKVTPHWGADPYEWEELAGWYELGEEPTEPETEEPSEETSESTAETEEPSEETSESTAETEEPSEETSESTTQTETSATTTPEEESSAPSETPEEETDPSESTPPASSEPTTETTTETTVAATESVQGENSAEQAE